MPGLRRRARLRALRRRGPLCRRGPLRRGALCRRPLRRRSLPMRLRRGRGRLRRLWLQLLGLHGNLLDVGLHGVGLGLLTGR